MKEKSTKRQRKAKKEVIVPTTPQEKLKRTSFFPKIFRFITERWKVLVAGVISIIIVIGIILQSIILYQSKEEEKKAELEREKTEKELTFWRESLKMYKDSRDIYFRIASLEYSLGDLERAQADLKKALDIDPNFKEGREMEKQIGL